jgi:hypothetical protein
MNLNWLLGLFSNTVDFRYYEATKCKSNLFIIRQFFNIISMEVQPEKSQKLFIISGGSLYKGS